MKNQTLIDILCVKVKKLTTMLYTWMIGLVKKSKKCGKICECG